MSEASPAQEPEVLEQLNNVKADAAELRNFTITFLSLLLYVNLIIASTDAEQILRIAPVNLPLLNVPLPIIGFYGFLPWLILLFHLYLLVQHYLFSQQLYRFNDKLEQAPDTIPAYVLKNLGNLPFLHWMVGQHGWMMQNVLTLITLVSLIFWPLATLLWLQMAILPYHSVDLLFVQRLALLIDVLLIAWLWPKTLDRQDSSRNWWKRGFALFIGWGRVWQALSNWAALKTALTQRWPDLRVFIHTSLLSVGLLLVVFFSWLVACLPDSWEDQLLTRLPNPLSIAVDVDNFSTPTRRAFFLTAYLHEQHAKIGLDDTAFRILQAQGAKPCPRPEQADKSKSGDADTHKPASSKAAEQQHCLMVQPWLPRNLILRGKVLTADANLKPEVESKLQAATPKLEDFDLIRGLDLQNRNFDYADFSESALPKADLRYASLKQAMLVRSRLDHAQMQYVQAEKANLQQATLTGANLRSATLTGADLSSATLTGADLVIATLTGANLFRATLTGANLSDATLTGANLSDATLTGANLSDATLTGADLSLAKLTGADLSWATLTGAYLRGATLTGADLSLAKLTGADLSWAKLTGANLSDATLAGAVLFSADLAGAVLFSADLTGAVLSHAMLTGAGLYGATLTGADLSWATLTGAELLHADLTGAGLPNTMLTGADLNGVMLTGTDLRIDTAASSQEDIKESAKALREALSYRPQYQSPKNQTKLDQRIQQFERDATRPADFSKAKIMKPCLRHPESKAMLPDCVDAGKPITAEDQQAFIAIWIPLACKRTPVAQRMIGRVTEFTWLARPLLDVALDGKKCPGLAGWSDRYKDWLRELASKTPAAH